MSILPLFLFHVNFITAFCLSLNETPALLSLCPKMHQPGSILNCNGGREIKESHPWIYSPWTRDWKHILVKAVILEDYENLEAICILHCKIKINCKINLEIWSFLLIKFRAKLSEVCNKNKELPDLMYL